MNAEQKRHAIKHFIAKFEAIPEGDWCVNQLLNSDGQRCALGHTMGSIGMDASRWIGRLPQESETLISLFPQVDSWHNDIAAINNGDSPRYQQPTPKQRVLAALRDLLAL